MVSFVHAYFLMDRMNIKIISILLFKPYKNSPVFRLTVLNKCLLENAFRMIVQLTKFAQKNQLQSYKKIDRAYKSSRLTDNHTMLALLYIQEYS